MNTTPAEQIETPPASPASPAPPRAAIGWVINGCLIAWMVFVFGVHYATYYGPRLARFWQFWIER